VNGRLLHCLAPRYNADCLETLVRRYWQGLGQSRKAPDLNTIPALHGTVSCMQDPVAASVLLQLTCWLLAQCTSRPLPHTQAQRAHPAHSVQLVMAPSLTCWLKRLLWLWPLSHYGMCHVLCADIHSTQTSNLNWPADVDNSQ
jgi:hypothetical protein